MAAFEMPLTVRFQHCDPAGIVFYPRYFEMFNLLVETWFDEALGLPFGELHLNRGFGVPTVRTEADFKAPSRLDEKLTLSLTVQDIGRSKISLLLQVLGPDGGLRVAANHVLVYAAFDPMRAAAIPEELKTRMQRFQAVPAK